MEEFNASAGTPTGPEDRAASASEGLDGGRLGGVLLQLQRERFDGVLNLACDGQTASIGFRDGRPVTFDDPTPGHTFADQFVERGQLTREQCNKVLAGMTDALVDDEAVAFCEHAVQLGFLTEDEAKVELSSRIRARMIQLFGWRECKTSLTPGLMELIDRPAFPQNLGEILYMGVRTFYDEDLLNNCHPDLQQTYVRLTTAPATIVQYFGLDDEEFQLLRRIQPDDPASLLVETRKVERVHLLALLLLMRMAQFCEVFNHPQPRATSPRMPHPRARSQTGPTTDDRSAARRAPGQPRSPHEDGSVSRRFDLPREDGSVSRSFDLPREDRSGARRPDGARDERSGSRAGPLPREEGSVARRQDELLRTDRSERGRTTGPRGAENPRAAARGNAGARAPEERSAAPRADALNQQRMAAESAADDYAFTRGPEELPHDDSSFAGVADALPREHRSAAQRAEERSVARSASMPPEPMRAPRQPQSVAQALQTPPQPPPQAARAPLPDPPPPGRSARPTVDATQEALLEAAARTARMRRSLPARRHSKQADPLAPAAEGGSTATKMPDASTTYTNAYASRTGNFDPSKSGSFDPSKSGSFDPSKSGSFDPSRSGSFDPSKSGSFDPSKSGSFEPGKTGTAEARPEYAKAHLKELIARRKHTASAPEATPNNQRDPARELREARSLLNAQQYARAEKLLSGLVELEPANELYKAYHLWARWRAQPEAADAVINELQDLAKKLVSDGEHGAFAAYVLGHVFLHNKRDDLAERFFKRAHAADRSNKDAERHLMILERRKHSAAEGGAGANRKLFGIQLPNKPKT